jgi:hypothetical protein
MNSDEEEYVARVDENKRFELVYCANLYCSWASSKNGHHSHALDRSAVVSVMIVNRALFDGGIWPEP